MAYFDSAGLYISSKTSMRAKITAIDNIITALMTTAANATSTEHITQYSLNDGQTVINTSYRGAQGVLEAIKGFETLKNMYINKLNGRMVRLVDSKNINYGSYGR